MKDDVYFVGKGIQIKLAPSQINNLYHPSATYGIEVYDHLYVKNSLNKKFAPILLKEWFFLIKPGGYIILEYQLTKDITFDYLESLLFWLFKGNYTIREHATSEHASRFIFQKRRSLFVPGDSTDRWTFGVITNGERDDWLEEIFQSIRVQKIPQYEIIVCGKYRDRKEKNFTYIEFNERADLGWITKKKNLIAEKAKYENLCIIHDRLVFDKDWYKGMRKYGNAFELLGCIQRDRDTGVQAGDWLTWGGPAKEKFKISRLNYTDWDYYVYLSGQLVIIKKSIWKQVMWNESHYWNKGEDADLNFRARDLGYLTRFNTFSKCIAITWRHGKIPLKYDIHEGLLPKDMWGRRTLRFLGRIIYAIPIIKNIKPSSYLWFFRSKFYRYLAYH